MTAAGPLSVFGFSCAEDAMNRVHARGGSGQKNLRMASVAWSTSSEMVIIKLMLFV